MEGRRPNGLAVVLVNCKDPDQEADFDRWYNEVHLPDVCNPGVFPRATRYQNLGAAGGDEQPRYLALYETDRDDPGAAWIDNREHTAPLRPQGRIHEALKASYVGIYKRRGEPTTSDRPVTGVLIVLNDCADPARHDEFNAWYDDVHLPDVLSTGTYHSAARYENTDPESGPRYLAVYETDADDPIAQLDILVKGLADMNAYRIDFIDRRLLAAYAMTYSTVSGPVPARV